MSIHQKSPEGRFPNIVEWDNRDVVEIERLTAGNCGPISVTNGRLDIGARNFIAILRQLKGMPC